MWLFAIVALLLIIIAFWTNASTLIIGLIIIIVGNAVSFISERNRFAPFWWNLATVAVTLISTNMFWDDLAKESVDYGGIPFIILFVYGLLSFAVFRLIQIKKG